MIIFEYFFLHFFSIDTHVIVELLREKLMSWHEFQKTLKYYRLSRMFQIDLHCVLIEPEDR